MKKLVTEQALFIALMIIGGITTLKAEQRLRRQRDRELAKAIHPSTLNASTASVEVLLQREADLVRLRLEHRIDPDTYQRGMSNLALRVT